MFGLAALAALLAMAFVGASSAMATTTGLCSGDGEWCQAVTHVHESTLTGSKAVLKTNILTVECDVLFLSTSVGTSAAPLIIKGNFTYSNCNNNCVATEENGPVEIKVLKTAAETSEVTGEGLVHLECGSFIDCLYNGEGLKGTGKGALSSTETNGEVKIVTQKVKEEGGSFFCPDTSELTITTTPLLPTYITGGLHYCVEYEHNTNGRYTTNTCATAGASKAFDLVIGPVGAVAGEVKCIAVKNGLWKKRSAGGACEEDAATLTGGTFEKGTIKTVQ
jgi:hypothetical protein